MPERNNYVHEALTLALEGLPVGEISVAADGQAVIRLGSRTVTLRLHWAGRGWPHEIAEAIREAADPWPPDLVVVAREFSPGSLQVLRERGANWADLTGRARIVAPGGLTVLREPKPPPRRAAPAFRWSRSAVSVAEAVLTSGEPVRTLEIAALSGWSPAQVSKVLQGFDRRGWTRGRGARRGPSASRGFADFDGLLAEWSQRLCDQARPRRLAHTTRRDVLGLVDEEIVPALAAHPWMLSGWAAAARLAPLATSVPTLQLYLAPRQFAAVTEILTDTSLHAVDEGGRIELWPADEHDLRLARRHGDLTLASPPRIYADLMRLGERGAEAAEHLKAWWLERPGRVGDEA